VKVVLLLWYGDEYWSMFDVNLSHVWSVEGEFQYILVLGI
jgi:hypothetical protein